ncbi:MULTISPECIES: hypothetical protein [Microbacterium]|uniref:Uncharacterized protein n=1 Tax=Microbacterium saccharophilum TaxID=1213358 RepID=A0A7Z7CZZ5_9MICO|nr:MULTISPECIES: hypothetical protein [Microbacterium]SFI52323.1 hypothetical protein SAMN04487751_2067 [Microbacterium saccharophilum]
MNGAPESFWQWAVPALIVFGAAAALAGAAIWALRRARRSPRARAAAERERIEAGSALVRLDDAVAELDIEVELSGALYDGTAPATLRRARMTAQHARDEAFAEFQELGPDTHPDEVTRVSRRIRTRTDAATAAIAHARTEHADWMTANVTAAAQVQAAQERWAALRDQIGDPQPLLDDLAARFDAAEWADAARAATDARAGLAEAERLLRDAAERAADPTRSALASLTRAERMLRRTQTAARTLEENHRVVVDAAEAVAGELEAARAALRQATTVRDGLEPADAARLGGQMREIEVALTAAEEHALRRPTATVAAVARLRDRLDLALGDARTAQQRLRGARTALPGALAAARQAIAHAAPAVAQAGADARVRLAAAEQDLARARGADDPVAALDAARRALRDAEDASALADYDRLTRG